MLLLSEILSIEPNPTPVEKIYICIYKNIYENRKLLGRRKKEDKSIS